METKKALFLPFMQIPTGHHHVADALIREIQLFHKGIDCDKVDILSYSFGRVERIVSSAYLNWIKFFPDIYDWLYRRSAFKETPLHHRRYLYEAMFMYFFKRLTTSYNARFLFCTHALPSNIASVLKLKNQLSPVTVNVYTDFFINGIWGIKGIDYHFVPTVEAKEYLMERCVPPERIYITGIPIDHVFLRGSTKNKNRDGKIKVLVTGGSLGVGSLKSLFTTLHSKHVHYYVLCGKNESLYEELLKNEISSVTPLSYIASKAEMNMLYDRVDAVLTKPGGVTLSECLMKRKPIFLYDPLPGQERINAEQLRQLGVANSVNLDENLEQQLLHFLLDDNKLHEYEKRVEAYHRHLDKRPLSVLMAEMT